MPNQPLSNLGYDIDIETLEPLALKEEEKRLRAERRVRKKLEEGQDLINELAEDGGQLIKEAVALYVERINQLIQNDPECQVFEKLFDTVGRKINASKRIVESKTKNLIG